MLRAASSSGALARAQIQSAAGRCGPAAVPAPPTTCGGGPEGASAVPEAPGQCLRPRSRPRLEDRSATRLAPWFLHAVAAALCIPCGPSVGGIPSSPGAGPVGRDPLVIAFPLPRLAGFPLPLVAPAPRAWLPVLDSWGFRGSWGFPRGSADKESTCNAGDPGSIPGLGRSAGEGIGYALQYSGLENSMDCILHEVADSDRTERLSLSHVPMQERQEIWVSWIPGSGRSPGVQNDNPLRYFCLENSTDRGAWWAKVHRVSKTNNKSNEKAKKQT